MCVQVHLCGGQRKALGLISQQPFPSQVGQAGYPASPRHRPVSASSGLGLKAHATMPSFPFAGRGGVPLRMELRFPA